MPRLDEFSHLSAGHFLLDNKEEQMLWVFLVGQRGTTLCWPPGACSSETQRYLVRFSSVRKGFPHCDAKTPHVTFAGELAEENAFWSVPLQRPFSRQSSLQEKIWKETGYQRWIETFPRCIIIFSDIKYPQGAVIIVYLSFYPLILSMYKIVIQMYSLTYYFSCLLLI